MASYMYVRFHLDNVCDLYDLIMTIFYVFFIKPFSLSIYYHRSCLTGFQHRIFKMVSKMATRQSVILPLC